MKDNEYNILWIDDAHEGMDGFKNRAKRHGIKFFAFRSLDELIDELTNNSSFYDGVLLDARFFKNKDDEPGSEDLDNVFRAHEFLSGLKKKFETFIFTGQEKIYKDEVFHKSFKKVYKKTNEFDINLLFSDIKETAARQKDTQLRHEYKNVFDLCTTYYIGEHAGQDILELLKVNDEMNIKNNFNTLRKIIEDIFSAFHKFKLLPDEFIFPNIASTPSSIFLSGNKNDKSPTVFKQYRHLEGTHLPKPISDSLKYILQVTHAASHRSEIDKHVILVNNTYLFKSILFQLFDVLVWFKIHIDSKPKVENWEKIDSENNIVSNEQSELLYGTVINKHEFKGFAFFKPDVLGDNVFIPPHLVSAFSLSDEMQIQVEIEEYIDNRSNELNTRVKRIKI